METNKARFRFYEELNDFLPYAKRKTDFIYSFTGNPSIKDAIESVGVPHTEVDLIIVNGEPVDFLYKLKADDAVSVYPVFESLDISGVSPLRPAPLRETKFISDVHLGRLTKNLRLCGFDTIFKKELTDREIVDISVSEMRIILTRDKGLLKNRKVTHGYWIRSTDPKDQLKEVIRRFQLENRLRPFSRCIECNEILAGVPKEEIIGRLLPQTREYYTEFRRCPGCNRIYWEGSHYEKMKKFLGNIIKI